MTRRTTARLRVHVMNDSTKKKGLTNRRPHVVVIGNDGDATFAAYGIVNQVHGKHGVDQFLLAAIDKIVHRDRGARIRTTTFLTNTLHSHRGLRSLAATRVGCQATTV